MKKIRSGRYEPVLESGMLVGWYDSCMYKSPVISLRKIYVTLMANIVRHKCSLVLHYSSLPIVNYDSQHYRDADVRFMEHFERVLERDSVEMVLVVFEHAVRYSIRCFGQGYSRITQSQGYCVLVLLRFATTHITSSSYMTELF